MTSASINKPNGGEVWAMGSDVTIQWSYEGIADNQGAIMELLQNESIVGIIWKRLIFKSQIFKWNVGRLEARNGVIPEAKPGNGYKIRIRNAEGTVLFAESEEFTLVSLEILNFPGEIVWIGRKFEFKLKSDQPLDFNEPHIVPYRGLSPVFSILLLDKNGVEIFRETCTVSSSIPLIVPFSISPGENYRIRVIATYDGECYRDSDPFTIAKFEWVNVVPKWFSGTIQVAGCRTSIPLESVDFFLKRGEEFIKIIAENVSSNESTFGFDTFFLWTVDELPFGKDYYIHAMKNSGLFETFSSEEFIICPSEIELNYWVDTARWIHTYIYETLPILDTHGLKMEDLKPNQILVGFDNMYDEIVWGASCVYDGMIFRGFVFIDLTPVNDLDQADILYYISIKIRKNQTTIWSGDEASNAGSAIRMCYGLNSPYMGGKDEFLRPLDQCVTWEELTPIDWDGIELIPPRPYSALGFGIGFIGPNESMLNDPESNHNNDRFQSIYTIDRVWIHSSPLIM